MTVLKGVLCASIDTTDHTRYLPEVKIALNSDSSVSTHMHPYARGSSSNGLTHETIVTTWPPATPLQTLYHPLLDGYK
jgi:hypothetical protein